jgi:predicted metal-dependent phosphoesterase TrpH
MRADLHVHSTFSGDGKQTVAEILTRCKELGIGAVAITDHNVFEAHKDAGALGSGIIIVPAMEVTSDDGHILAMGISTAIPRGRSVAETIEFIHSAGGIAIAPHPYRTWSGLGENNVREHDFDAVEIANGRSKRAGNVAAKRLAKLMAMPVVGGSDAHSSGAIGRAYTELPDDCQDYHDIIKAIIERRSRAFGTGQGSSRSARSGMVSVLRWSLRGFRRM